MDESQVQVGSMPVDTNLGIMHIKSCLEWNVDRKPWVSSKLTSRGD